MSDNLIPFPHTNGSNGSAQVRVVPYPARARVIAEHGDHPLDAWFSRAVEICNEFHGISPVELSGTSTDSDAAHRGAAGAWRNAFIAGGHRHDAFVRLGIVMETFESAITWDRFDSFVAEVRERAAAALGPDGRITVRVTHAYPDGAAPYFTVLAPARRGAELEQWDEVKAAASEAIELAGGTITHHHAVGRDHRPWYDRQRPEPFAIALRAAKAAVDPQGMLNPGVLVDP